MPPLRSVMYILLLLSLLSPNFSQPRVIISRCLVAVVIHVIIPICVILGLWNKLLYLHAESRKIKQMILEASEVHIQVRNCAPTKQTCKTTEILTLTIELKFKAYHAGPLNPITET